MPQQSRRVLVLMHRWVGYLHGIQLGMADYFMQHGEWIWTQVQPQPDRIAIVTQMTFDGIIAYVEHAYLNEIKKMHIPVVDVSNWLTEQHFHSVLPDDLAIGRLGARYLRDLGLRNFGVLGHDQATYSNLRSKGFIDCLAEEGFAVERPEPSKYAVPRGVHVPHGVDRDIFAWLLAVPKPFGLFGTNDDSAAQVLDVCRHAGIRVPEDVCVLGVDNDELVTQVSTPPLSSIALPTQKIGYEAARLLDRLMSGEKVPKTPIVFGPVGVVTRQSTDLLAIADEDVQAAVRFIREHVHERITVNDLLRVVPVNRRYLERKFKQHIGRTPLQEIRRIRLEKAKDLLSRTDLPMPTIARQSGFPNPERLANVFRAVLGITPTEHRKRFSLSEKEQPL